MYDNLLKQNGLWCNEWLKQEKPKWKLYSIKTIKINVINKQVNYLFIYSYIVYFYIYILDI